MQSSVRYKKVFILGAGFSKAFATNMPTLDNLTEKLTSLTSCSEFPDLARYAINLKNISGGISDLNNIETLSHLLLSKAFYSDFEEQNRYQRTSNQLLRWIYKEIDTIAPMVDDEKRDDLLKFIEFCSYQHYPEERERKALLLSFNYDLLVERLIQPYIPSRIMIQDYFIKLNSYFDPYCVGGGGASRLVFSYLKLHGSFNWFLAPSKEVADITNVYWVDENDLSKELIHPNHVPVFIPMSYSKTKHLTGSLFNVLWNIAISYFDNADELNFIGYGFPLSDIDNLELFLKYKNKIRDIVVFNDKQANVDRLNQMFPNANIIDMDAYEYIKNQNYM